MIIKGKVKKLNGEIMVPGDKSISHRSIIMGSIAQGETLISGILRSQDVKRTINAFKNMGVNIIQTKNKVHIEGVGKNGLKEPNSMIQCGNSGTTMRLLSGILAGQEFSTILIGDESLSNRPMDRIIKPLKEMGANIKGREEKYAPLEIRTSINGLNGINYRLPMASAQVKSAILLATLYAKGSTRIIEEKTTRDHTERMLNYFGCNVLREKDDIYMNSKSWLKGKKVYVPGDISSAAYFIVASSLIKDSHIIIKKVGINPTRTGIIQILRKMGAKIKILNKGYLSNEPVADIEVKHSKLKGVVIDENIIGTLIDEIPIIAVAASLAEGSTIIKGAEELKYKESNRITSISNELRKMGAIVWDRMDGMVIEGIDFLESAELNSYNDHRIAMALSIAALTAKGESRIQGHECVNISYPDFYSTLFSLLK